VESIVYNPFVGNVGFSREERGLGKFMLESRHAWRSRGQRRARQISAGVRHPGAPRAGLPRLCDRDSVRPDQMTLAEIRSLVAAGACDQPLPRRLDGKCLILSLTVSTCCSAKELLVRSRSGGFVARDCLNCGTQARYVKLAQLPDLDCAGCLRFNRAGTVEPILKHRNYWYTCGGCRREWEIAAILPDWSEAFEYSGLAAPGDPGYLG
jgi:hypothetical protein